MNTRLNISEHTRGCKFNVALPLFSYVTIKGIISQQKSGYKLIYLCGMSAGASNDRVTRKLNCATRGSMVHGKKNLMRGLTEFGRKSCCLLK